LGVQEAELGESLRQSIGEQRNIHFPNLKQGFQVGGSCPCVCKLNVLWFCGIALLN